MFQSEVVRPLKRSYTARQSLLQSIDAVSQSNSISNKVYSAIEITSEGLNILRKLHKQVTPMSCSDPLFDFTVDLEID